MNNFVLLKVTSYLNKTEIETQWRSNCGGCWYWILSIVDNYRKNVCCTRKKVVIVAILGIYLLR